MQRRSSFDPLASLAASMCLIAATLLAPIGARLVEAEEFSLAFPAPALCRGGPQPGLQPQSATIFASTFERIPEFEANTWNHTFPELSTIRLLDSGDFNCDGRSDLLAQSLATEELFLGLATGSNSFFVSSMGTPPPGLRWDEAIVAPYQEHSCASLLVPKHGETRLIFAARFCQGQRFEWQQIDFPHPRPEFRNMHFGDALAPGTENFFSVPFSEAPYFLTEMLPSSGGGREKIQSSISPGKHPALGTVRRSATDRSALLLRYDAWEYRTWMGGDETSPFLRLSHAHRWKDAIIADLNGDSLSDLVLMADGAQGNWVALAYGDYRLLFPNLSLTKTLGQTGVEAVGDFNGDGRDELLIVKEGSLVAVAAKQSRPVPQQTLLVGGRPMTTDEQGALRVDLGSVQELRIAFPKPSPGVTTPSITRRVDSRRHRPIHILFDLQTIGEHGAVVRAPNVKQHGPYLCAAENRGGEPSTTFGRTLECPPHFAFFEMDDSAPPALGTCCRLPADDILSTESAWIAGQCPEDSLLTAIRERQHSTPSEFEFRCTRINTKRYSLSPAGPGYSFGDGSSLSAVPEQIDRTRIPLAYRQAFGSIFDSARDRDGCLGQPWGAMLTAINGKDCQKLEFRTLLEKSEAGELTPVTMYPPCQSLADPYDPSRGCLLQE